MDQGVEMGNVKVVGSHPMEEEVATVLIEDGGLTYPLVTLMETDTLIERMVKLLETGLVGLRLIER